MGKKKKRTQCNIEKFGSLVKIKIQSSSEFHMFLSRPIIMI